MKLHELLKNIKPLQVAGDSEVEITGVNIDSRRIAKGHLFVAMRGTQVDGHKFIGKAIDQGAVAVLCEEMPDQLCEGVTYIQVDRRRRGPRGHRLLRRSVQETQTGGRDRHERQNDHRHLII